MAFKLSTGLRTVMLGSGSLKGALDGGLVKLYSGPVPATADAALDPGNTLLCTISNNSTGNGISFDAPAAGVINKAAAETWSGVNGAAGVATFYRHVAAGDTGVASTTQARIQGAIATSGAELNLSNTTLANGAPQTIDFYSVALPTL